MWPGTTERADVDGDVATAGSATSEVVQGGRPLLKVNASWTQDGIGQRLISIRRVGDGVPLEVTELTMVGETAPTFPEVLSTIPEGTWTRDSRFGETISYRWTGSLPEVPPMPSQQTATYGAVSTWTPVGLVLGALAFATGVVLRRRNIA